MQGANYANVSTIINDNLKSLPLLLFVLEAVNSRTMIKSKQLSQFFFSRPKQVAHFCFTPVKPAIK